VGFAHSWNLTRFASSLFPADCLKGEDCTVMRRASIGFPWEPKLVMSPWGVLSQPVRIGPRTPGGGKFGLGVIERDGEAIEAD
jgi:hypothetical protein